MLRMSGLLDELQQHSHSPTGEPLCIPVYGDPAYPQRIWLHTPYRDSHPTEEQLQFNASMSTVRVAVERVFADILTYYFFFLTGLQERLENWFKSSW